MSDWQFGGYGGGGINRRPVDPSAKPAGSPTGVRTTEGQAARKLVDMLDKMSFNTIAFAQLLVSEAGPQLRRRIMDIVIAIIREYASQWPHGSQDDVSRDAMRLKDTLDDFKM